MTTGGVANVHSDMDSTNKTLLKSDALYKYVLDTTVLPREHQCMRDLRLVTDQHKWYLDLSPSSSQQIRSNPHRSIGSNSDLIDFGCFAGGSCSRRRTRRSCWGC